MTSRVRDEELIREVESTYDRAWAAGDVDAVVACLTDDAILVNPWGEAAQGIAEIKEIIGAFLRGPAHGSVHDSRVVRVSFVTPDVSVVDGEASIYDPGRPDAPILSHRFTDILVRKEGHWRIAHIRAYAPDSATKGTAEAAQQVVPPDARGELR